MICYFKNIITCVSGEWSSPLIILQETCSVLTYDNSRIVIFRESFSFSTLECFLCMQTAFYGCSSKFELIVGFLLTSPAFYLIVCLFVVVVVFLFFFVNCFRLYKNKPLIGRLSVWCT